jgi:hypothetical protein
MRYCEGQAWGWSGKNKECRHNFDREILLRVFENRVLRRIFAPKRDEVT